MGLASKEERRRRACREATAAGLDGKAIYESNLDISTIQDMVTRAEEIIENKKLDYLINKYTEG